jgi:hypothetical protein
MAAGHHDRIDAPHRLRIDHLAPGNRVDAFVGQEGRQLLVTQLRDTAG